MRLLHRRTFENYKNWCRKMASADSVSGGSCVPQCGGGGEEMDLAVAFRRGDSQGGVVENNRLIKEVLLWWCVWGEAANMRFMPEFICWVFYGMVQDLAMELILFNGHRRNYLVQVCSVGEVWVCVDRRHSTFAVPCGSMCLWRLCS